MLNDIETRISFFSKPQILNRRVVSLSPVFECKTRRDGLSGF